MVRTILQRALIAVSFIVAANSLAHAESGITDSTITLGQSAPFTGPIGNYGMQLKDGANVYFEYVNKNGGIFGRKISVISLDDGYEEEKAVANTKTLIEGNKVFALFNYYGTASTTAAMKVFSAAKVPLFGTISGASALRTPVNRYMFNLRASYNDETAAIVTQLTSLGMKNIAVFYQNDGFGKAGLDGVTAALKLRGLTPSAVGIVERNSQDVSKAVAEISKADPQAVVMVTLYKPTAEFVRQMKAAKLHPQFVTLSPVSTDLLAKELGDDSRGIGVTQVMPYPWTSANGLAHEYNQLAKEYSKLGISYYGIEGFAAAKVMVEALRKAGKDPTREKLITAFESINNHDLGGIQISFSPTNHSGSKFTELTVIGKDGKVLR